MKTFEEICKEVAAVYGSDNYRKDFENGLGILDYTNQENFFTIAAERYANYKAGIAFEEAREECKSIVESFGKDIIVEDIEEITNPYSKKNN